MERAIKFIILFIPLVSIFQLPVKITNMHSYKVSSYSTTISVLIKITGATKTRTCDNPQDKLGDLTEPSSLSDKETLYNPLYFKFN